MLNPHKTHAQVHRFHAFAALYLTNGETKYLQPCDARRLAAALIECADDIDTQPDFCKGTFRTQEMNFPTKAQSGLSNIDDARRLYCLHAGDGYRTLGFDYADTRARAVLQWLLACNARTAGVNIPAWTTDNATPGTAAHFALYESAMRAGADFHARTGERCPAELVPALAGLEGKRVEATVYGERVRFTVGKSTGWMPAHLMLRNSAASGGEAISADSISDVRVIR